MLKKFFWRTGTISEESANSKEITSQPLTEEEKEFFDSSDEESTKGPSDEETLSAAIKTEQEKRDIEEYRHKVALGARDLGEEGPSKKKIKKSAYFSDEEESD